MIVPRPGEIYYEFADEDQRDGPRHRTIVVSRRELNRGDYVVAVPLTSKKFEVRSRLQSCVAFRKGQFGLTENCVAACEHVSAYLKSDLDLEAGVVGRVSDAKMAELVQAIGYMMSATCFLA